MTIEHQNGPSLSFLEKEATSIQERVLDLARRLTDPIFVGNVNQLALHQSRYRATEPYRHVTSLTHGPLGLALMYGELDNIFPGEQWDRVAHQYFTLLQEETIQAASPSNLGLFNGACGILFVAHYLSREGTRYTSLRRQIEDAALPFISGFVKGLPFTEHPLPERYSLSGGILGVASTLLFLSQTSYRPEATLPELHIILQHLVWLAQRLQTYNSHRFDHWYSLPDLWDNHVSWSSLYRGYGMYTGLAGHIALISLALQSGLEVNDLSDALQILCTHLQQGMRRGKYGWYWPQEVIDDVSHRSANTTPFAWCNGTCGIARALWLAGCALNDGALRTLALECIANVGQYFRREMLTIGPSLCHGLAGMLLVCLHFAHESTELAQDVLSMINRLLEMFEGDRPFGYRAFEPGYIRTDSPWLLEGAAGVTLALLAAVSPRPPAWERILLLS